MTLFNWFILASLLFSVIALVVSILLYRKTQALCLLDETKSLPNLIKEYQKKVTDVEDIHKDLLQELQKLGILAHKSIQKTGFKRQGAYQRLSQKVFFIQNR